MRIRPPDTLQIKVQNGFETIFTTALVSLFGLRTPQILSRWTSMYVLSVVEEDTNRCVNGTKANYLVNRMEAIFDTPSLKV